MNLHSRAEHSEQVMETLFTTCAVVGGTVLVCQLLLTLLGMGEHHGVSGGESGIDFHADAAMHPAAFGHDVHASDAAAHDPNANPHDTVGHHGSSWFFRIISFRTV